MGAISFLGQKSPNWKGKSTLKAVERGLRLHIATRGVYLTKKCRLCGKEIGYEHYKYVNNHWYHLGCFKIESDAKIASMDRENGKA